MSGRPYVRPGASGRRCPRRGGSARVHAWFPSPQGQRANGPPTRCGRTYVRSSARQDFTISGMCARCLRAPAQSAKHRVRWYRRAAGLVGARGASWSRCWPAAHSPIDDGERRTHQTDRSHAGKQKRHQQARDCECQQATHRGGGRPSGRPEGGLPRLVTDRLEDRDRARWRQPPAVGRRRPRAGGRPTNWRTTARRGRTVRRRPPELPSGRRAAPKRGGRAHCSFQQYAPVRESSSRSRTRRRRRAHGSRGTPVDGGDPPGGPWQRSVNGKSAAPSAA